MLTRSALAGAGLVLGLYAIGHGDAVTLPLAVQLAVGWTFVAAGFVAWTARPANRTGLLMMLTGCTWFVRDFDQWHHVSDLSLNVFLALVASIVVVFPQGVARTALERRILAAVWLLAVPGYVVSELGDSVNAVLSVLGIVAALAIVLLVVQRWTGATPPARRALVPLVASGPIVLFAAALSIMSDYLDVSVSSTADKVIDWAALAYTLLPIAFLVGLLRSTLQRGAVGGLVIELSDVASPDVVRDALARTLNDPSLELAFWLPRQDRYVDRRGHEVALPDGDRAVEVLENRSGRVAALIYEPSLLENPGLVRAAGAAALLALDNARLQAELRTRIDSAHPVDGDELGDLTPRELEVLALLAEGRTDRGIAETLYVTPKTVEAHVRSIFRKLDLPSESSENRRVHAVLAYLRARSG